MKFNSSPQNILGDSWKNKNQDRCAYLDTLGCIIWKNNELVNSIHSMGLLYMQNAKKHRIIKKYKKLISSASWLVRYSPIHAYNNTTIQLRALGGICRAPCRNVIKQLLRSLQIVSLIGYSTTKLILCLIMPVTN